MRVCYFGSYYADSSRNSLLIEGLRLNGVEVVECHDPLFGMNAKSMDQSLKKTCVKYLINQPAHYVRLLGKLGKLPQFDALVVGFLGYQDVPLAYVVSKMMRVPLVFDPFLPLYNTVVEDRKFFRPTQMPARMIKTIESRLIRMADIVLADSQQHSEYFSTSFGLPRSRIATLNVGADEDRFYPITSKCNPDRETLDVLFYGTFIRLHGIEHIVRAAKLLESEDIRIKIIGTGQEYPGVRDLANELGPPNLQFVDWVDYALLPQEIARADICLGIFGTSEKAARVVPNKAYQCIAMGKPLITGDTEAARTVFKHRANAFLCRPGDGAAIAEAVMELNSDPALRGQVARGGLDLFRENYTKRKLGERFKFLLEGCLSGRAAVTAGPR
jgi:glycosyltransferase involved in cell wall biosynthesis